MKNENAKKFLKWGLLVVFILAVAIGTIGIIGSNNGNHTVGSSESSYSATSDEEDSSVTSSDEETVTVTFDAQGGSSVQSIKVKKGEKLEKLPQSFSVGESFDGWYTDKQATNEFNIDSPIDEDITLYAGYKETAVDINDSVVSEKYEEGCESDLKISFICNEKLTKEQFLSKIDIEANSAYMPEFDVQINGNEYILSPKGEGYYKGKLYKISIPKGIKFKQFDDSVKEYSFRIAREESDIVKLNDSIIYIAESDITNYAINNENGSYNLVIQKNTLNANVKSLNSGNVLCITEDGVFNSANSEESVFIKITDVKLVGDSYFVTAVDAEIEDVYSEVDVYFENAISSDDIISRLNTEEIKEEIYANGSDKKIAKLMSALVASSKTFRQKLGAAPDFTENTYLIEDSVKTLLDQEFDDAAEISIKIGKGHNPNFDAAYTDEFVALSIEFSFEKEIKEVVKVKASFTLTQYLAVSAQGSLDYETGFFKIKWVDFDVAMNLYSQTDIDLTVLICSIAKEDEEEEDYIDITEEIEELLENEEDEEDNNLVEQLQEMLESESGYIELFRADILNIPVEVIPALPVMTINFELDFVVKMNFAAGLQTQISVLEATQIGIRGDSRDGDITSYKNNLIGGDQYSIQLTACGYLGFKAGFEGGISVSFCGLSKLGKVGVYVDVGAYVDLYGFAQATLTKVNKNVSATVVGGYYIEVGIYLDVTLEARSDLFKVKVGVTLFSDKWPLTSFGNKDVLLSIEKDDADAVYMSNDGGDIATLDINALPTLKGEYIDITTGKVTTKDIPWSKINLSFSNKNFSYDSNSQTITYKNGTIPKPTSEECIVTYKYKGAFLQFNLSSNLAGQLYPFNQTKITYFDATAIDKDNAGKHYTASVYTDIDGVKKLYKEYDVLAGNTLKECDLSLNPYQYVNISWNKIPYKTIIAEDTEFICTAQTRQTYVAFIYYDELNDKWITEIRACDLGEIPVAPTLPEGEKTSFVQWKGENGYNNKAKTTSPIGLSENITKEDMSVRGLFINTTYGHDMSETILTYDNKDRYSFEDGLLRTKTEEGYQLFYAVSSIYTAQYKYEECQVTLIDVTTDGEVLNQVDYSVPYYGKLTTYSVYSSMSMKLKGLSKEINGDIIYKNIFDVKDVTCDMTLYVIYEPVYYEVTLNTFDAETLDYKPYKTYKLIGLSDLSELDFDGAKDFKDTEGVEYTFYGFKNKSGNNMNYVYSSSVCNANMDIYPIFERKVSITYDFNGGQPLQGIESDATSSKNDYELYLGAFGGKPADEEATYKLTGWENMTTHEIIAVGSTVKCSVPTTFKAVYEIDVQKEYTLQVSTIYGVLQNGKKELNFKGSYKEYNALLNDYQAWLPSDVRDEVNHCTYKCSNSNIDSITLPNTTSITYTWKTEIDKHKVTLDGNGGYATYENQVEFELTWNSEIQLSKIFASKNSDEYGSYKVKQFEDDHGNIYKINDRYIVETDTVLKVIWEVDVYTKYKVTFYLNGELLRTDTYNPDEAILNLGIPEEADGLIFSGWSWYDEDDNGVSKYTYMPTFNLVLKGTTAQAYIIYKVDGIAVYKDKGEVGKVNAVREQYQKQGYTSTPWASEDVEINNNEFIMPEKDVTLYSTTSVNSYKVTYYHKNSVYGEYTYNYGSFVTLISVPQESNIYYAWSSDDVALSASGFIMPNRNVIVRTISSTNRKYVMYFINDELIEYVKAVPGETIALYDLKDNTKYFGLTFSGWYSNAKSITSETIIVSDEDMFIYGYYTKGTTKVNIYLNNDNNPDLVLYGNKGDTIVINTSKQDFDFKGFNINNNITDKIEIGEQTQINAYAVYAEKEYELICFNIIDKEVIKTVKAKANEKIYLPELPLSEYEGLTFDGWYTFDTVIKEDGQGKYIIMPENNVYLNALSYSEEIGYNAKVYITTPFASEPLFYRNYIVYSDLIPTYFDAPQIEGLEFVGWQDVNGKAVDGVSLSDMKQSDQIYYGIYRKVELHVIKFVLNNEVYKYEYYYNTYEVSVPDVEIELKENEEFSGWQNLFVNPSSHGGNIYFYIDDPDNIDYDLVFFGYTYASDAVYCLNFDIFKNNDNVGPFEIYVDGGDELKLAKTCNDFEIAYQVIIKVSNQDDSVIDISTSALTEFDDYYLLTIPTTEKLQDLIGNKSMEYIIVNAYYNNAITE